MNRTKTVFACAVILAVPTLFAAATSSAPTPVFLRPEASSFWTTATNSTMTLPVCHPRGSTTATLTVSGVDYSRVYPNLTGDSVEISLPAPYSPKTENVFTLTLEFDNGTVQTAKLGLIQGKEAGASGFTRCLSPAEGRSWATAKYRAVLPIPYGMESFSVKLNDGEWRDVDTGLNGAQGWYALAPIVKGDSLSLSNVVSGVSCFVSLMGGGDGFTVILK